MAYGPGTDIFGLETTGVHLQSVGTAPSGSNAQARDANGDITNETVYGSFVTITSVYKVANGVDSSAVWPKIGGDLTGYYCTGIRCGRSNDDTLEVSVDGIPDTYFNAAPDTYAWAASMPTGYLTGGKGALAAGITVSAGEVISSSIDIRPEITPPLLSSAGVVKDMELFGTRMEATNETQAGTGVPAAAAAAGWQLNSSSGSETDDNTSYGTKTFTAFKNILAD